MSGGRVPSGMLRVGIAVGAMLFLKGDMLGPNTTYGDPPPKAAAQPAPVPGTAPSITINGAPAATPAPPAAGTTPPPGKAAGTTGEVLPWANGQPAPAPQLSAAEAKAADERNAACSKNFEAPCREAKTCVWVGDIRRADGSVEVGKCVGRAPKKGKVAKPAKKPDPKPAAAATGTAPAAAAVTAPAAEAPKAATVATPAETTPTIMNKDAPPSMVISTPPPSADVP